MELIEALLLSIVTGVIGFLGNHFLHNLSVKKENIQKNRDRLLLNIYKVDNFIKSLIELRYIRGEITKITELIKSSKTDFEKLSDEMKRTEEEISFLEDKLNQYVDPSKLIDVKTKICSLSTKLADISSDIKQKEIQQKTMRDDLALNGEILKKLNKSKHSEDLISALFLIDPMGEIVEEFTELSNIYLDSESTITSETRALILRLKIDQFLSNKINKFK